MGGCCWNLGRQATDINSTFIIALTRRQTGMMVAAYSPASLPAFLTIALPLHPPNLSR